MPSISVIVPVYQAEKFLRDCVESVRRQTFSDWELLLVDDGCTDGSPALCDELAREDDRIRVFHKERNSGVSETRNVGLDHVRGTYIAFLDSDDQYEPQCLETLWNLRERASYSRWGPKTISKRQSRHTRYSRLMESTFWSSMLPMLCILWNIWARRWLGGILSKEEVGCKCSNFRSWV